MIKTSNISLQYGSSLLFKDVNLTFNDDSCYGIIGANGAGKSTFLKLLAGIIEPTSGQIIKEKNKRISFLRQDQNEFDEFTVLSTVLKGHKRLTEIIDEKEKLYLKEDFDENDGMLLAELESEFLEMDGYEAEANALSILAGLGIDDSFQDVLMKDCDFKVKVKVLLAQALFANPDILLLDEPTNNLDMKSKRWLENFLLNFKNVVILVSHDRHFLNNVCTHICDIDYKKITMFAGNYEFWYMTSQLILRQKRDSNKKAEAKIKELKDFIARFSANASKSKQATSRKKILDKIIVEDIEPSNRKFPYIGFKAKKDIGNDVLTVDKLSKDNLFSNLSFNISKNEKVAFVCKDSKKIEALFNIIAGVDSNYTGTYKWGITAIPSFFLSNYNDNFKSKVRIIDWLKNYSQDDITDTYIRGFLGRMLFSGEDVFKYVDVLSGGEKVRLMMSKIMIEEPNILLLFDPTNHLDLESISALNEGMSNFKGNILFYSNDEELLNSVATRIIYLKDNNEIIDKNMSYEEFLELEDL